MEMWYPFTVKTKCSGRKNDMGLFDAVFKRGDYREFDGDWIHPTRVVDFNEVIYVVKGTVYLFEDDRKYELHKGDCIVLEKGKKHGGYECSGKNVGFYWFEFFSDTGFVEQIKNVAFGSGDAFLNLARKLVYVSENPSYSRQAADCYIRLILNEIEMASKRGGNTAYPVCGIIAEWIRKNSDRKIEVDEISRQFGYNKDYISRAFKRNFGMSLKEYIDAERLKYIKGMLIATSYPLKQISQMTGFHSYKSFLKFFTYHNDITPYQYRKQVYNSLQ